MVTKREIGLEDAFGGEVYCQVPKRQRLGQKKVRVIWNLEKKKKKRRNEIKKKGIISRDRCFSVLAATRTS